jgi:hypothetical protein
MGGGALEMVEKLKQYTLDVLNIDKGLMMLLMLLLMMGMPLQQLRKAKLYL